MKQRNLFIVLGSLVVFLILGRLDVIGVYTIVSTGFPSGANASYLKTNVLSGTVLLCVVEVWSSPPLVLNTSCRVVTEK